MILILNMACINVTSNPLTLLFEAVFIYLEKPVNYYDVGANIRSHEISNF